MHVQSMNIVLLKKWMNRIIAPQDDLAILILRENYCRGLDWESRSSRTRGVSPFWQDLRQIFPRVCDFFAARLGGGSIFQYWLDAWLT